MTTPKQYSGVLEMVRDLSGPSAAAAFEARTRARQVVRSLLVMRNKAGLSQAELAARLGWSQSKVSKLETGTDADASFGDLQAVAAALGEELVVTLTPLPPAPPPKRPRRRTAAAK